MGIYLFGLDLFSGIGGLTLALSPWVLPIAYCENDRYAQGVLLSRMAKGDLPNAPIWDDIKTLKGSMLPIKPDIIYGGFPCQNLSVAGNGEGLGGEQSKLFFEIMRLSKEIKPSFIFLENVPAIRTRGLSTVGRELAKIGYDCRWGIVSAYDVGAPHIRERWFCLAHSNSKRVRELPGWGIRKKRSEEQTEFKFHGKNRIVANTECKLHRHGHNGAAKIFEDGIKENERKWYSLCDANQWSVESCVDRVVAGIPFRLDRIRGLGNSVVPQQAREAFKRLAGL